MYGSKKKNMFRMGYILFGHFSIYIIYMATAGGVTQTKIYLYLFTGQQPVLDNGTFFRAVNLKRKCSCPPVTSIFYKRISENLLHKVRQILF